MKLHLSELRRRGIFKTLASYAVAAFVLVEAASMIAPAFRLPEWTVAALTTMLVLGAFPALYLAWRFEFTNKGIERDKSRVPDEVDRVVQRLATVFVFALLAITVALWVNYYRTQSTDGIETMVGTQSDAPAVGEDGLTRSIAVLPFVNLSNDAEQEYFADGLADEILTVLARVPGINVAPRSATFRYKGDNLDIAQVVRELDVSYVLTGSVRRADDRVRVFAELIGANDKSQLWSSTFEGQLGDVFSIQDEIALAVGRNLEARLVDAVGNTITVSGTNSVEAHNAYLKGRFLLHKRGDENVRLAITHFREATELDPEYVEAFAELAYAKSIGWRQVDKQGAKRSAARAIELDTSLPQAWIASAQVKTFELDLTGAEQAFRKALELEPRNASAWHGLARVIDSVRGPGEALSPGLNAVTLDPGSAIYRAWLGHYYMALGEDSIGMTHLDSAMEIEVTAFEFPMMWKAVKGDIQGAEAVLEKAKEKLNFSEDREAWHRAFILLTDGRVADARSLLTGREFPEQYYLVDLIVISEIAEVDEANRILEAAFATQGPTPFFQFRGLSTYMPNNLIMNTYLDELLSKAGLPSNR